MRHKYYCRPYQTIWGPNQAIWGPYHAIWGPYHATWVGSGLGGSEQFGTIKPCWMDRAGISLTTLTTRSPYGDKDPVPKKGERLETETSHSDEGEDYDNDYVNDDDNVNANYEIMMMMTMRMVMMSSLGSR